MKIYLKEKIGRPELFTGRNREISDLLNWVHRIEQEISQSSAILSRRKTGKTALLQRLYNIVFHENTKIIPFYYEIKEKDQYLMDFSIEFFLTFVYQFLAFKTRNPGYLDLIQFNSLENAYENAADKGFNYLAALIQSVRQMSDKDEPGRVWDIVRDAPRFTAGHYNEYMVQIIDEFQFINRFIFRDRACTDCIKNLAGSYLHTAEYKNAPLLVSGSWIGWLMDDLRNMLPGRFKVKPLENMPRDEIIEMIYKYSHIEGIPVTQETAFIMADLCEGNPFYISALFRSEFRDKDFTRMDRVLKTIEFETTSRWGAIKGTWMEYVNSALSKINDQNAKKIVLYLCQNKDREITRKEIHDRLNLEMNDSELEIRMDALVKSDIINRGASNFDYRAVQDNIFDKVFRSVYQKEITAFDPKEITNEYKALYRKIAGEYNKFKGEFSEYVIINNLKYKACKNNSFYKSIMNNLPDDFKFESYDSIWSYKASPVYKRDIQIDVFARAEESGYSLIGEVKNRKKKFSLDEAKNFISKAGELVKLEQVEKPVLCVFSFGGFYKNALKYLISNNMAWTEDRQWLE